MLTLEPKAIKALIELLAQRHYDIIWQLMRSHDRGSTIQEEVLRPQLVFDHEQAAVVQAPIQSRMLIEAGPGSGKTAVACARVGYLIEQGAEPANILLVSFTRTAVQEMRDRIESFLHDPRDAAGVRIATVDSYSWRIWTGFLKDEIDDPFEGYGSTIAGALNLLKSKPPEVIGYLDQISHVLIDEAQDLQAERVELLNELLKCVGPDCGVTVFTDPAQAIYGFTSKDEESDPRALARLDVSPEWDRYEYRQLITIHRTKDDCLKTLWTEARPFLLSDELFTPCERYRSVDRLIRSIGTPAPIEPLQHPADLNLFRWRADVLDASQKLGKSGILHRLRMSALPACVEPWIAACFSEIELRYIAADEFRRMWESVPNVLRPSRAVDDCWRELLRLARAPGKSSIDLERLRRTLSAEKPPITVSLKELGSTGPILSTIHASKGREADVVCAFLPDLENGIESEDVAEEGRVLYVAATRPRHVLQISRAPGRSGFFLDKAGRVCRRCFGWDGVAVEFGRDRDTEADPSAPTALSPEDFETSQAWLRAWQQQEPCPAYLIADRDHGFRYSLQVTVPDASGSADAVVLSFLPKLLNDDLFSVAKTIFPDRLMRPSMRIGPVYVMGVRTIAFAPGDERVERLPERYRRSGMILAPVWWGFPEVNFKQWN